MNVRALRKTIVPALGSSLLFTMPALAGAEARPLAPQFTEPARKVCPVDVPRTLVIERGFEGGAALIFVTRGPLDMMRARVRGLAELHNRVRDGGDIESEFTGAATVQEIERGAVLRFERPGSGAIEPAGSTSALVYAQALAGEECPLLRDEGIGVEAKRPPSNPEVPMPSATIPGFSPSVPTPVVGGAPPVISF